MLAQLEQAYDAFREDGVLPATYEVIYGHAWMPEAKVAGSDVQVSFQR